MKIIVLIGAAALLVPTHPAAARAAAPLAIAAAQAQRPGDPADSLYRTARQAANDEDYARAARLFGTLVDRYPRSDYAGDALYWRAWALFHVAQTGGPTRSLDDAIAAIDRQQKEYASAATVRDGKDLRARILAAQARRGNVDAAQQLAQAANQLEGSRGCPAEDDDMRLAALQGLMQMDAADAVPILKQVLARRDACSEQLRRRALFMLSQKSGDDATNLLLDVARRDPSDQVRAEAVQWLGQSRSERAAAALDSILFSTKNPEIQKRALFAVSQRQTDEAVKTLRRAAEDESLTDEVRMQAIFWMGQRGQGTGDLAYLRELFGRTKNEEMRKHIIQAVGQSRTPESRKWLLDLARDESATMEMRKNAVFWAGQQGASAADMAALYDEVRGQDELRKQVVFALSQSRDSAATDKMMQIARGDPDREMRKQAIFWLGQRKDPRVVQFLMELIKQ